MYSFSYGMLHMWRSVRHLDSLISQTNCCSHLDILESLNVSCFLSFLLLLYSSGFTVFWDFISIPEMPHGCCQLTVTLYNNDEKISESRSLPLAVCGGRNNFVNGIRANPGIYKQPGLALVGVKQIFPKYVCLYT